MKTRLSRVWRFIRRLSGDDAYERYLAQHAAHGNEEPPLSKKEFYRQWQDSKWQGVKRCC